MTSATLDAPRGIVLPNPSPRAARLDDLGAAERLHSYRAGEFDRTDLAIWAMRYPDEIPTVNGELEWIALTLADLDD
ncbi:MAG: hypothetical protein R2725_11815 [Solirubrobacterales bacterium]